MLSFAGVNKSSGHKGCTKPWRPRAFQKLVEFSPLCAPKSREVGTAKLLLFSRLSLFKAGMTKCALTAGVMCESEIQTCPVFLHGSLQVPVGTHYLQLSCDLCSRFLILQQLKICLVLKEGGCYLER